MTRKYDWNASSEAGARRHGITAGAGSPSKCDPTTADIAYTPDEVEFMMAMHAYTTRTGRKFPTYHEILAVLRSLGYSKTPPGPPS